MHSRPILSALLLLAPALLAWCQNTTAAVSFYSSEYGPFVTAATSCWLQIYTPLIIGTVSVVVNQTDGLTTSTTVFDTDIVKNGTAVPFSRTDTDAAGTVTATGPEGVVTYPTGALVLAPSFTWSVILPTSRSSSGPCCQRTLSSIPTFSHTPLPPPVETVDSADPSGWQYELIFCGDSGTTTLLPESVSSVWADQAITIDYSGCGFTTCGLFATTVATRAFASSVASILATTTTTLSSVDATTPAAATPTTSQPTTTATTNTLIKTTEDRTTNTPATPETTTQAVVTTATPVFTTQPTLTFPGEDTSTSTKTSPAATIQPEFSPLSEVVPTPSTQSAQTMTSSQDTQLRRPSQDTSASPAQTPPPITIGSTTFTAVSLNYVIGTQTLAPGSTITVSGQAISYPEIQTLPPVTIGSTAVSPVSSQYIIAGQTLQPGAEIVVSGTTISLASGGTQLVVGTSTEVATTNGVGGYVWTGVNSVAPTKGTATATQNTSQAGRSSSRSPYMVLVLVLIVGVSYII